MRTPLTVAGCSLAMVLGACGPTTAERHAATAAAEEQSERDAFISKTNYRLEGIEAETGRIEANVKKYAGTLSDNEVAMLNERLGALRKRHADIASDLQRVQDTSGSAGQALRTSIDADTGELELDVMDMRQRGTIILAKAETAAEKSLPADAGLCPLDLAHEKISVEMQKDRVVVTARTEDKGELNKLHAGARSVGAGGYYSPGAMFQEPAKKDTAVHEGVPVSVLLVGLADGVKIVLVPKNKDALQTLNAQVGTDMRLLEEGRCKEEPPKTASR